MKTVLKYACKRKDYGFLARADVPDKIFTDDISEARLYLTKQNAARKLDFRRWDSDLAKEELEFFEVEVTIHEPEIKYL